MKWFLALLIFLPVVCIAQEKKFKNEVGVSAMNISANLGFDNCFSPDATIVGMSVKSSKCYYGRPRYNSMSPEIYFSRLLGKKFRVRANFGSADFAEPLPETNDIFNQRIEKRYTASLGLQWEFYYSKKWTVYTGIAAKGFLIKDILYNRNLDEIFKTTIETNYLLRPKLFIGTQYKFSRRFSVSTEAAFEYGFYPLSRLSINYHF